MKWTDLPVKCMQEGVFDAGPVRLQDDGQTVIIGCDAGVSSVEFNLIELIAWLKINKPELLK